MPKKSAQKAARPSRKKQPDKTAGKAPARPAPRKGKTRAILPEVFDPSPPPAVPPAQTATTVSHELPADLPIFLRWSVDAIQTKPRSVGGKGELYAVLKFDGKKTHRLDGHMAKDILQRQADAWNKQEYVPTLGTNYMKQRPSQESFLRQPSTPESKFSGVKPFTT